jgi:hypothetical protein
MRYDFSDHQKPMKIPRFTAWVRLCIEQDGYAKTSPSDISSAFAQRERRNPMCDAIMNFTGLPTEMETYRTWLKVNEWREEFGQQPRVLYILPVEIARVAIPTPSPIW